MSVRFRVGEKRIPVFIPDAEGKLDEFLRSNSLLQEPGIFAGTPLGQHNAFDADPLLGESGKNSARSISIPNWPSTPSLELNALYLPTGVTRYTRGCFLMRTADKDALVNAIVGGEKAFLEYLALDQESAWTLLGGIQLHPLAPRPLSGYIASEGGPTDTDELLWLVPVVDARYFWQGKHAAPSSGSTWLNQLDSLANALRYGTSYSSIYRSDAMSIDSQYLRPHPIVFDSACQPAPALEAAIWSINLRCVPNTTGTTGVRNAGYYIIDREEAEPVFDSQVSLYGQRIVNGGDIDYLTVPCPDAIRFSMPYLKSGIWTSNSYAEFAGTFTTATMPRSNPLIVNTVYADRDTSGAFPLTPPAADLTAERDNLVARYGQDWYAWRGRHFDYTFAGIVPWVFSGYEDAAIIRFATPGPDGKNRCETRVWSLPPDVHCKTQLSRSQITFHLSGASSTLAIFPDEVLPPMMLAAVVYESSVVNRILPRVDGKYTLNVVVGNGLDASDVGQFVKINTYNTGGSQPKTLLADGAGANPYLQFSSVGPALLVNSVAMVSADPTGNWSIAVLPRPTYMF